MAASTSDDGLNTSLVYLPEETSSLTVKYLQGMQVGNENAVKLPIPIISDYFAPLRPGQIAAIIGQSSHYKSGLLHFIEREHAATLQGNKVVFHISTEEDIEEQGITEISNLGSTDPRDLASGSIDDWDDVFTSATRLTTLPVIRIGISIGRERQQHLASDLHLSLIQDLIKWTCSKYNLEVSTIGLDYLQALPIDPDIRMAERDQQRRLQVRSDVYRLREMAFQFKCGIWVNVQAKQKLDGALSSTFQMPGMYDGEETSTIAQRFDRIISIWLPKQSWTIGKEISLGNSTFEVEEDLLFLRVTKQRGSLPSGKIWKCRVDYFRNTISVEGITRHDD